LDSLTQRSKRSCRRGKGELKRDKKELKTPREKKKVKKRFQMGRNDDVSCQGMKMKTHVVFALNKCSQIKT
jgi:hypothetical protein